MLKANERLEIQNDQQSMEIKDLSTRLKNLKADKDNHIREMMNLKEMNAQ